MTTRDQSLIHFLSNDDDPKIRKRKNVSTTKAIGDHHRGYVEIEGTKHPVRYYHDDDYIHKSWWWLCGCCGLVLLALGVLGTIAFAWYLRIDQCTLHTDPKCSDGDPCTVDFCDEDTGVCIHNHNPGWCSQNSDCNQNQTCVGCICTDTCNNTCFSNPCYVNECRDGTCVTLSSHPGCCLTPTDCNDGNDCTRKQCIDNACVYDQPAGTCTKLGDCYGWGVCINCTCVLIGNVPGHCNNTADCDDGDPCTLDICQTNGECHWNTVPNCCEVLQDCPDPPSPCNQKVCLGHTCVYFLPPGLCAWDGDCHGFDVCVDCSCIPGPGCKFDEQCNDQMTCTIDICKTDGNCSHIPQANCCEDFTDCISWNPCFVALQNACMDGVCCYTELDTDNDGVPCSSDCNDSDNTIGTGYKQFRDRDGDHYGVNNEFIFSCSPQQGYNVSNGECNDEDQRIFPGSYTYDQCEFIQGFNATMMDQDCKFNQELTVSFSNYVKPIKILIVDDFMFVTWNVTQSSYSPSVVVVFLRSPTLPGGWVCRQVIEDNMAADTVVGNAFGLSLAFQNFTLVISQRGGPTINEVAEVWKIDPTTSTQFTHFQTLDSSIPEPWQTRRGPNAFRSIKNNLQQLSEPIYVPSVVDIDEDLIIVTQQPLVALTIVGHIWVFRIDPATSLYKRESVIIQPTALCYDNLYTFPMAVALRHQTIFASEPRAAVINCAPLLDSAPTDNFGVIWIFRQQSCTLPFVCNWAPPIQVLYTTLTFAFLGDPQIRVNQDDVLVAAAWEHGISSSPRVPPFLSPGSGALIIYKHNSSDLWEEHQIIMPNEQILQTWFWFGGPNFNTQINSFDIRNQTIVSFSAYGDCNSFFTLTSPQYNVPFFFGSRVRPIEPAFWTDLNQHYLAEMQPCGGAGVGSFLTDVFLADMTINQRYHLLEVGLLVTHEQLQPAGYPFIIDPLRPQVVIYNCDKLLLC